MPTWLEDLHFKAAAGGLDQAQQYCIATDVQFAALTSGFEWRGYWAVRTAGNPPKKGKAIVFPGLDAVQKNFAEFYDLFSRQGLMQRLYLVRINQREGLSIRLADKLESVVNPNEIKLLLKSGQDPLNRTSRVPGGMMSRIL